MEFYSALKKKEIMSFVTTWMNLEGIILSEISQRKTNIEWFCLHVESKKNKTVKLIETKGRKVVVRGQGMGEIGRGW